MKKFKETNKFKEKNNKVFHIRLTTILLLIFVVLQTTAMSYAHSGRTDSNGGHYDRSTGEYHYHHGYPPHQHENGVCPYELSNTTLQNQSTNISNRTTSNSSSKTSTRNTTKNSTNNTVEDTTKTSNNSIKIIIFVIFGYILYFYIVLFINFKKEKHEKVLIISDDKNIKFNSNQNQKNMKPQQNKTKYICPKCGGKLIIKSGKYGRFIGCSNYPSCKYTKSYNSKK